MTRGLSGEQRRRILTSIGEELQLSQGTHLLLISLGPVQDFIRTARRSRDYWYGSRLLSELAKIVAQVVEREGGELIFPPPEVMQAAEGDHAVANKVVARVASGAVARGLDEPVRTAVNERLLELWAVIADRASQKGQAAMLDGERGRRQLAELIELQWVAVPIGGDYFQARTQAEALLSARKATRDWAKPSWGEGAGVPKSSLDGAREQVFDEALREALVKKPWRLRAAFDVRAHESLCGPGLLKRLGGAPEGDGDVQRFHSTSHMAAAPLLWRVARAKGTAALVAYHRALRDAGLDPIRFRVRVEAGQPEVAPFDGGDAVPSARVFALAVEREGVGYDGSLFFEGRLAAALEESPMPELLQELEGGANPAQILSARADRARTALRVCLKELGVEGVPCPYYAFLLADGDHMGRAFGAMKPSGSVDEDIEQHRRLAWELAQFALEARAVVLKHGGSLIYAGGDDVSAMLPLHTAVQCARALRDLFGDAMEQACPHLPAAERPTLSAGLAFVHHMTAMSEARALAEAAEKAAKDPARGGRDALAIVADKRSGATLEIHGRWYGSRDEAVRRPSDGLDERLLRWCALFRAGRLSHGAAFELEALLRPFERGSGAGSAEAVRWLAERAIQRRRVARAEGSDALDAEVRSLLKARIGSDATVGVRASSAELQVARIDSDVIADVRALSAELQVARLMLGALRDAWGPGAREAEA